MVLGSQLGKIDETPPPSRRGLVAACRRPGEAFSLVQARAPGRVPGRCSARLGPPGENTTTRGHQSESPRLRNHAEWEAPASRAGPGRVSSMGSSGGQLSLRSLSLPLGAGPQGAPPGGPKMGPGRGGVGTARTFRGIKGGHRSLTVVYRGGPPRGPTALGAVGNGGPRVVSLNRLLVATYLSFLQSC